MKKILSIGLLAFLLSGCTNVSKVDNSIEKIAKELAQASLNNDKTAMVEISNKLLAENAIPKEIQVRGNCHVVIYSINGNEHSVEACK